MYMYMNKYYNKHTINECQTLFPKGKLNVGYNYDFL